METGWGAESVKWNVTGWDCFKRDKKQEIDDPGPRMPSSNFLQNRKWKQKMNCDHCEGKKQTTFEQKQILLENVLRNGEMWVLFYHTWMVGITRVLWKTGKSYFIAAHNNVSISALCGCANMCADLCNSPPNRVCGLAYCCKIETFYSVLSTHRHWESSSSSSLSSIS